jgi:hypothetical protein
VIGETAMEDLLHLSNDDSLTLEQALRSVHQGGGTVRDLLRKWTTLVREVERGYTLTIYDYENDLDVRSILERVLEVVAPASGARLKTVLAPLDARFARATTPFPLGVRRGLGVAPGDWWYFRQPSVLTGELAADWNAQ